MIEFVGKIPGQLADQDGVERRRGGRSESLSRLPQLENLKR